MPETTIRQLAGEVATILGDALALECQPEESPFPDIENRVRILAPGILSSLLMESPLDLSGAAKPFPGKVETDSDNSATIPLPDDFLRLAIIRLKGWKRPVFRLTSPAGPEGARQNCKWSGIRGNPDRPVALRDFDSEGNPCIRLIPASGSKAADNQTSPDSSSGASLETGAYIPRPAVSDADTISIPPDLKHPLLPALAKALSEFP